MHHAILLQVRGGAPQVTGQAEGGRPASQGGDTAVWRQAARAVGDLTANGGRRMEPVRQTPQLGWWGLCQGSGCSPKAPGGILALPVVLCLPILQGFHLKLRLMGQVVLLKERGKSALASPASFRYSRLLDGVGCW